MKYIYSQSLIVILTIVLTSCGADTSTDSKEDSFANEALTDSIELFRQAEGWKPSYIRAGEGLNFLPIREGELLKASYDKDTENKCPLKFKNPITFRKDRDMVLNVYADLTSATPAKICISDWGIDFDGYGSTGRDIGIKERNYKTGDLVCGVCTDDSDVPISGTSIVFIAE